MCGGYVADLSGVLRAAARLHGSWRLDVPSTHVREALTVVLANLAREQPVVVLLDDMHLADASSWETLDYVARNMLDNRVLVLVCARLGEMVERAVGEHVLFGLEQDGVLTRLDLQRLKEPYVRELAERVLGRPSAPPGLAAWLFRESQGNPLFTLGLLDAVLETGVDLGHLGSRLSRRRCLPASLNGYRLWTSTACPCSICWSSWGARRIWRSCAGSASLAPPSLSAAMARLVPARLIVARDADDDPTYELAIRWSRCIYAGLDPAPAPCGTTRLLSP